MPGYRMNPLFKNAQGIWRSRCEMRHQPPDVGTYLPSPQEIAAACREIQDTWSESVREARWQGEGTEPVEIGETPFRSVRRGRNADVPADWDF